MNLNMIMILQVIKQLGYLKVKEKNLILELMKQ